MEALYGQFFLSNYQHDLHLRVPQAAGAEAPRRAARPAAVGSPQASGSPAGALFALKPPPPPTALCAVGSPAGGGKAVVIDELRATADVVPLQAPGAEADEGRLNVAGVLVDDDEQVLLGADSVQTPAAPLRQGGDGIDSDSESEAGAAAPPPASRGVSLASAAPSSPPPRLEALPQSPPAAGTPAAALAGLGAEASTPVTPAPPSAAPAPVPAAAEAPKELQALPAGFSGKFRVHVPKPYPGVQYRRSMRLEDKGSKIAADGETVGGVVEEGGKWLRVTSDGGGPTLFLPTRIEIAGKNIHILKRIPANKDSLEHPTKKKAGRHGKGSPEHSGQGAAGAAVPWWTCCVSKDMLENCEVVVDRGSDVTGTSPILSTSGEAGGSSPVARRGAGLAAGPRLGGERPGGG